MSTDVIRAAIVRLWYATAGCVLAGVFLCPAVAHAGPPGPSLSFSQWPGGMTVSVTDNSGITSWCRYSAEWYAAPPFLLAANSTYPLVIPLTFPDNRIWNVNVNCDNGASTHTTYNYVAGSASAEKTCKDGSKVPADQPCLKTCQDGSRVFENANCEKRCVDGRSVPEDAACPVKFAVGARPHRESLAV